MRYTTAIDLTETPRIWNNKNAARLYMWMAFKCGYHSEDRDKITISIRNLSAALKMSESAVRHSLRMLAREGLVLHCGSSDYVVTKFVEEKPIGKRQKKTTPGNNGVFAVLDEPTPNRTPTKNHYKEYIEDLEKRAKNGDRDAAVILARHQKRNPQK